MKCWQAQVIYIKSKFKYLFLLYFTDHFPTLSQLEVFSSMDEKG